MLIGWGAVVVAPLGSSHYILRKSGEEVVGQHAGGDAEPVLHDLNVGVLVVLSHLEVFVAFCQVCFFITGVVDDLVGNEALVGHHSQAVAVGQDIAAGIQAGIVLEAEQVQQGRQHIGVAAGLVDGDGLHRGVPDDQIALVALHAAPLDAVADHALPLGVGQTVGEVVGGQSDDGFIQLTGLVQTLNQILKRPVKLDVGGKICSCGSAHIQVFHQLLVLFHHGVVAAETVVVVTGNRHVVGVEPLIVDVIVHSLLHHHQVGFRPAAQTADLILAFKYIADVGVGLVTLVIGGGVVVVGTGGQTLGVEPVGNVHVHGVLDGIHETAVTLGLGDIRHQTGQAGILTVGGVGGEGGPVVSEVKTAVGQLVQGGGQLRVDALGREGLGGDEDQVVALEHAGILIFLGGLYGSQIIIDLLGGLVGLCFGQCCEIQAGDHIVAVLDGTGRLGSVRFIGGDGDEHIGNNFLLRGDLLNGIAQEEVLHINAGGGEQPQLFHAQIQHPVVIVVSKSGVVAGAAQRQQQDHQQLGQQESGGVVHGALQIKLPLGIEPLVQERQQSHRQKQQQNGNQTFPDGQHNGLKKVGEHIVAHTSLRDRHKGLEGMEIDDLHAEQDHRQHQKSIAQDPGDFFREQVADRTRQNTCGDRKQNREPDSAVLEFPDMEHQLHVGKADGEKYRREEPGKPAVQTFWHLQGRYGETARRPF